MLQLTPEQANSALAYSAYEAMMTAINLAAVQTKANQLADELGKTQAQRDEAIKLINAQQGTIVAQQATIEAKTADIEAVAKYNDLTVEQLLRECKPPEPPASEVVDPVTPLPVLVDVVDETSVAVMD